MENDIHILQHENSDILKFCPVIHHSGIVLATTTRDKKQVKVHLEWK